MTFEQLILKRRSVYHLSADINLSVPQLEDLLKQALLHCPTAFNSQSGRLALLLGSAHQTLWKITLAALRPLVPSEKFAATQAKIQDFAAGAGTVLFFIDDNVTADFQKRFPLYRDHFSIWAEQAQGMLQYIVWTLLAEHRIGASLQHYNPLIDAKVNRLFHLPSNWRLSAQMPFGKIAAPAEPKTFLPIENRLKIFASDK